MNDNVGHIGFGPRGGFAVGLSIGLGLGLCLLLLSAAMFVFLRSQGVRV